MSFKNRYEETFNFLGSWFPDMDYDDLTEERVVSNFKKTIDKDHLNKVILEIKEIQDDINDYWEKIVQETNLYFEDANQVKQWLDLIISYLKE